jgi:DNA-binding transcriptional regulator YiaG
MNTNVPQEDRADRVLPIYEDKLSGIPVSLINSAIEGICNGAKGVVVPDPEGLQIAVAVARVTVPHRLSGSEIRILRKAMGMQARALAEFLDVTPETFSRWENDREPIGTNPERLLRLRVYQTLRSKAPGVTAKSEDILNMTKVSFLRLASRPVTLVFEQLSVLRDHNVEKIWVYRGLEEEREAEPIEKRA